MVGALQELTHHLAIGTTACTLSTANRTVTICSPTNGSSVASPVHVVAGSTDSQSVVAMQVYVDDTLVYEVNIALDLDLEHRITVTRNLGLVEACGRGVSALGNSATLWRLTEVGREFVAQNVRSAA